MRLRYTLPALADLASILDYIADRSPQGALRIQSRIQAITNLLLRYPGAGAPTFYEATDNEIIVHAVRHGARDVLENPRER